MPKKSEKPIKRYISGWYSPRLERYIMMAKTDIVMMRYSSMILIGVNPSEIIYIGGVDTD